MLTTCDYQRMAQTAMDQEGFPVRVWIDEEERVLHLPRGANLRQALLDAGISPYGKLSSRLNCGGRGLCATCGVLIITDADAVEPAPVHWHDRLAKQFGYPRLSCQITIDRPLTIHIITDKFMWQ